MAPAAVEISHKVLSDPRQVTRVNAEALFNYGDLTRTEALVHLGDLRVPLFNK